jgi:hypothetical protein
MIKLIVAAIAFFMGLFAVIFLYRSLRFGITREGAVTSAILTTWCTVIYLVHLMVEATVVTNVLAFAGYSLPILV